MKRSSIKVLIGIAFMLLSIMLFQNVVLATTVDTAVLQKEAGYIVYVEGYYEKDFEFAFSEKPDATLAELVFKSNGKDTETGRNIAYLEGEVSLDSKNYLYVRVKDSETNEYVLEIEGLEVDVQASVTEEDVSYVKETTKRINVEIGTEKIRDERVEEILYTTIVGKLTITDADVAESEYSYVMYPVAENADAKELMTLAETIAAQTEETDIMEIIHTTRKFLDLYNGLRPEELSTEWQEVTESKIMQPDDAENGDKYVVFIQKQNGNTTTLDAQFMTSVKEVWTDDQYEQDTREVVTKLPVTGESIVIFIVLGVAVVLLVVLLVIKNKNKKSK